MSSAVALQKAGDPHLPEESGRSPFLPMIRSSPRRAGTSDFGMWLQGRCGILSKHTTTEWIAWLTLLVPGILLQPRVAMERRGFGTTRNQYGIGHSEFQSRFPPMGAAWFYEQIRSKKRFVSWILWHGS